MAKETWWTNFSYSSYGAGKTFHSVIVKRIDRISLNIWMSFDEINLMDLFFFYTASWIRLGDLVFIIIDKWVRLSSSLTWIDVEWLIYFSCDFQLNFICVYLVLYLYRFDCGSGTGKVRSDETVVLNQWNSITVFRHRWDAWIMLNQGRRVQGRSKVNIITFIWVLFKFIFGT